LPLSLLLNFPTSQLPSFAAEGGLPNFRCLKVIELAMSLVGTKDPLEKAGLLLGLLPLPIYYYSSLRPEPVP